MLASLKQADENPQNPKNMKERFGHDVKGEIFYRQLKIQNLKMGNPINRYHHDRRL